MQLVTQLGMVFRDTMKFLDVSWKVQNSAVPVNSRTHGSLKHQNHFPDSGGLRRLGSIDLPKP